MGGSPWEGQWCDPSPLPEPSVPLRVSTASAALCFSTSALWPLVSPIPWGLQSSPALSHLPTGPPDSLSSVSISHAGPPRQQGERGEKSKDVEQEAPGE